MNTVIFCAPASWGKTRNAENLRVYFGCATVIDEWKPTKPIKEGALHLTEPRLLEGIPDTVKVVSANDLDALTKSWLGVSR